LNGEFSKTFTLLHIFFVFSRSFIFIHLQSLKMLFSVFSVDA
jgi:hypothetical protein